MRRKDILEREDEIRQWISEGRSKVWMTHQLKCKDTTLNTYLKHLGIEYEGVRASGRQRYVPVSEYLGTGKAIRTHRLKEKLLHEGIKDYQCEGCGLTEWQGQPIPIELDHIDGDPSNNNLDNLRILCPNCHAQTPTHAGKNIKRTTPKKRFFCECGKEISKEATTCKSCVPKPSKIDWPDLEMLQEMVERDGYSATGRTLGVSDNAVRKHIQNKKYREKQKQLRNHK